MLHRFDTATTTGYVPLVMKEQHAFSPAFPVIVLFVLAIGGFSSCTAHHVVNLDSEGAGDAQIRITLEGAFSTYLEDLTATLGSAPAGSAHRTAVFDLDLVHQGFAAEPLLDLRDASMPRPDTLDLTVRFAGIPGILARRSDGLGRILFFERAEGMRRLVVRLDRDAVEYLLSLVGVDPFVAESLLPPRGDMSAGEYLEYLSWAMEEYEEERPIRSVLREAEIVTRISLPGEVMQIRNGTVTGTTATFRTPVLDLLTTGRPIEYVLVFSPR